MLLRRQQARRNRRAGILQLVLWALMVLSLSTAVLMVAINVLRG